MNNNNDNETYAFRSEAPKSILTDERISTRCGKCGAAAFAKTACPNCGNQVQPATTQPPADETGKFVAEIFRVLLSIRSMLTFFTVLTILSLVVGFLYVCIASNNHPMW